MLKFTFYYSTSSIYFSNIFVLRNSEFLKKLIRSILFVIKEDLSSFINLVILLQML